MTTKERGFSMIDLVAAMAMIAVLSTVVVPQLLLARDRGRLRRSLGDMRKLSIALSTYQSDNGGLFPSRAQGLAALQPDYFSVVPDDGWGTSYLYDGINTGCAYLLMGLGSNALIGAQPARSVAGRSLRAGYLAVQRRVSPSARTAGRDRQVSPHRCRFLQLGTCTEHSCAPRWQWGYWPSCSAVATANAP